MPRRLYLQGLLHEPECLAGFMEGSCGVEGNMGADLGYFQQFCLSLFIPFLCRLLLCKSTVSFCIFTDRIAGNDNSL